MAFLTQVRSGGKQYIYLTEYCGNQLYSSKNERTIYAFGSTGMAMLRMKRWLWKYEEFPQELKDFGFDRDDLEAWLRQLETGRTPRGNKFRVEREKVVHYNIYNIY